MIRFKLYVPVRDNPRADLAKLAPAWRPSDHVRRVRADLQASGVDGWTEYDARGVWHDDREAVRVFEILVPEADAHERRGDLRYIARTALADQDSVLITEEPINVTFVDTGL